jgi:hypothetical protein
MNLKMMAGAGGKAVEVGRAMGPKLVPQRLQPMKGYRGNCGQSLPCGINADLAAGNGALVLIIGSADPARFQAILTAFPGNADLQMS